MPFPPPATLLPHAGRAVLLDAVVESTEAHAVAVATIMPTHPYFVPGHGVPVWVGMEMMAQVIAVHAALTGCDGRSGEPRHGMLLGTRHYDGRVPWFGEGLCLRIHAARSFGRDGGMGACACHIEGGARLLAEATLIILEETTA